MKLTSTFRSLLLLFRDVFTAPTYATFVTLATGWCLSPRHRYVTEMIQAAHAVHRGHPSRYHRFFSSAAWSVDDSLKVYFDWEHAIFGNPVFSNAGRFQKSNDLYWMRFQVYF
jgi:hypothetical protein